MPAHADALVLAHRGLGRVLHEQGNYESAMRTFAAGAQLADDTDRRRQGALLRMSWSASVQLVEGTDAALRMLDEAEPALDGADLGLLVMQRGLLHWMAGDMERALASYDAALPILQQSDERLAVMRLVANRGIVHAQSGRLRAARSDMQTQHALAVEYGQHTVAATALQSLGWLAGKLGDVPQALRLLAEARAMCEQIGNVGRLMVTLDTDEGEILLQAHLAHEADELAERLVRDAEINGNVAQAGEALLMRARAQLAMGRSDRAHEHANAAERLFRSSGRLAWAAMASYVGEQATFAAASEGAEQPVDADEISRLREIAGELERAGWYLEAAEVRVHAGRAALRAGLLEAAHEELTRAARARSRGPAAVRAEAWHATALLRLADQDRRGALRAIDAGLRALHRHRATLGAMELRAHASAHGVELGRLGLRLALSTGTPGRVLTWAERWRAGALALPSSEVDAEAELAALREIHAAVQAATSSGAKADASAQSRIADAERAITTRSRLASGGAGSVLSRISVGDVRRELHGRTLVEFVELDRELHAVVVDDRRARLIGLGPSSRVLDAHDHLTFALRRVSMLPHGHPSLRGAIAALDTSSVEVDALLLAPLELGDRDLIVVPTGGLHRVAWSAMPSLADRAVTIAPSAAWWLARTGRDRRGADVDRVLLVEGPDLDGTAAELAAIRELVPDAVCLFGEDATAERVLAELAVADVAHIAAHGSFRSDNPLFSTLRVADGPIWVHDLAGLSTTPRLVILTACEAGRSGVLAGDELLGTATALLSLGVQTVVAPLLPVPDIATARFAVRFHHHLAAGLSPAHARAATAADERAGGDPSGLAVASTFQCIGNRFSDLPRIRS